ncbi:hypothetical protein ABZ775_33555, partial [Streptomyces sp. NPDC047829]
EQEAVEIRRRLAQDNPAAHEPNLATSLTNLSVRLAKAGRHGDALTTTAEAVKIYRRLAQDNPAAHEPNLATSLAVFAMLLVTKGDLHVALRATGGGCGAVPQTRCHGAARTTPTPRCAETAGGPA